MTNPDIERIAGPTIRRQRELLNEFLDWVDETGKDGYHLAADIERFLQDRWKEFYIAPETKH